MLKNAVQSIKQWAKPYKSCLIAFSGGQDSTLLLYLLREFTHLKLTAITVDAPYTPQWELAEAKEYCKSRKIEHVVIKTKILETIKDNPKNRCYLCKHYLFSIINNEAQKRKINIVVDGTNFDDNPKNRPGMKALEELSIVSPLRNFGLGKSEIKDLSSQFCLPTAKKTSCSCLMTRLPYNYSVKKEELDIIGMAEQYIHKELTDNVRFRIDKKNAIVEIGDNKIDRINKTIKEYFKSLGFDRIVYKSR